MKRALLLLPLVIYLLLPTREFYWDGVAFAIDIEKAHGNIRSVIEPNHLIYGLTGYLLHAALGSHVRVLFLMQALNGILAGLSVLLVYRILREITGSEYRSRWLALWFAFSATWWKFATDADAYIPSVFFLLLCSWLLFAGKKPRPFAVAVLHTVAMLFHQLAVFFLPVAVAGLWRQGEQARAGRILRYTLSAFLLTLGVYVCAYPGGGFFHWITTHSSDSAFSFDIVHNLAISLRGNLRLFVGGKLALLKLDAVTLLGLAVLAMLVAMLVWRAGEIVRVARELRSRETWQWLLAQWPLLIWIGCYLLFLAFWLPQNTFYRLFYLPAVVFLVGALGLREKAQAGRALAITMTALFLWNFTMFIYPHARIENNEPLRFAIEHHADWPPGTRIVFHEFHSDLWTISYFNPQASWMGVASLADIERGHPQWLEGTAYDLVKAQPGGEAWLANHIDMPGSLIYHSPGHTNRFYRTRADL